MFKGAFGAGFAKGFGTTISEGIEQRRKEREKYLDMTLDNARAAAPGLAASDADVANMSGMFDQMNADFGITKEEFLGLAENYDINKVYQNVYTAKTVMEKNGINGMIDKAMILGGLKVADKYKFSGSVEDGLRMIFQGAAANVDPKNKSEAHRTGAFGKAVANMLMLNPRMSAEEMAQGMHVAGVPVDRLLAFQAAGGVKSTPFGQIEATGPFQNIDIQYSDGQYAKTSKDFSNFFSKRFAKVDLDMDGAYAMFEQGKNAFAEDVTKDVALNQVTGAGLRLAQLEKFLVANGLSQGMGNYNQRRALMLELAQGVETVEEMNQLSQVIQKDSSAAKRILEVHGNDGYISAEEMQYILYGTRDADETPKGDGLDLGDGDDLVETSEAAAIEDTGVGLGDKPAETPKKPQKRKDGKTSAADLIERNEGSDEETITEQVFGTEVEVPKGVVSAVESILSGDDAEPAKKNLIRAIETDDYKTLEAFIRKTQRLADNELAAKQKPAEPEKKYITYEDWKDMDKAARKRLGLDVSKVKIQNMVRGGKIEIPQDADTTVDFPDNTQQLEAPEGATRQEGFQLGKFKGENVLRVNDRDIAHNQREINQEIMEDGRGLMSQKAEKPPITLETTSIEEPTVPVELVDLADMMKRVHGTGKVFSDYEALLEKENPSYTQINKLLRATKKLRKTETRDKLMQELYLLAEKARG